jgi:hypothetical protein
MINTTKTKYVRIDGWRGYLEPVNAIAGCNDTGTYEDSPCPSDVAQAEINSFVKKLRKEKIKYRTTWGNSSNVFMVKRFVCVSPKDRTKAQAMAHDHMEETRLFYQL